MEGMGDNYLVRGHVFVLHGIDINLSGIARGEPKQMAQLNNGRPKQLLHVASYHSQTLNS